MTLEKSQLLLNEIKAGTLKRTAGHFKAVGETWTDLIIWITVFEIMKDGGLPLASGGFHTEENRQIFEDWLAQACQKDPDKARRHLRKARKKIINDVIKGRI